MADGGEGKDARAVAHVRPPRNGDMRDQLDILTQFDLRPHHAKGPDLGRRGDAGSRLDDGRGMNLRHGMKLSCPGSWRRTWLRRKACRRLWPDCRISTHCRDCAG